MNAHSHASPYVVRAAERAGILDTTPDFKWRYDLRLGNRVVGYVEQVPRWNADWQCDEFFWSWVYISKDGKRMGADETSREQAELELESCAAERG